MFIKVITYLKNYNIKIKLKNNFSFVKRKKKFFPHIKDHLIRTVHDSKYHDPNKKKMF